MKFRDISHRHRLLFGIVGATALLLIGAIVGFVILLSGAYSTAATTQHFALTHRLLDIGLQMSVRSAARDVTVPPLNDATMIQQGMACLQQHCVQCHGAPARAPDPSARGMLPIPSSLTEAARDWSAASLYYITKKGIRMTGMPAWEFRLSEHSLWSTVALLAAMPTMNESQFGQIADAAKNSSCPTNTASPAFTSDKRGDVLLRQYACDSCHRIDGVIGPESYVGPALIDWPKRKYIAGVMPNTQDNLVRWIRDPQAISAQSLMPDLDVPDAHAREMAIYLLTPR
jgi:mono/diheme cytochrome c family protein/cytochrome c551/c552